jgi:HlyD family secretion protein
MRRRALVLVLLALAGAGGALAWWLAHREGPARELTLHGNVDLRQVDLAFNHNERIVEVLVQEGDRVARGQLLARLDTSRLEPQAAQAEAQVAAQLQVFERLKAGSRPEEIAQARANVESAKADAANARRQFDRMKELSRGAVSLQDFENAKAALDVADARLVVNEKALELSVLGPRKEEIAEAEARFHANEAQLALLKQYLADARLISPCDAVVRSRVMEPGEMASPQRPVLSLAQMDPKWVRAYLSEPDLGRVHYGMAASVSVDSFPEKRFEGWVGFISPVAEFTPKSVETDELRTSLVYEVRVFVKDPSDDLRLGMPATVRVALGSPGSAPVTSRVAVDQRR